MAMHVEKNKIFIFIADSDANDDNRIQGSNNSEQITTNYCPPETQEMNKKFYSLFGMNDELSDKMFKYLKTKPEQRTDSLRNEHYTLRDSLNEKISHKPVVLNLSKFKKYRTKMIARYKNKYASLFKGGMKNFENICDQIINDSDLKVAEKIKFTGDRPYLNFEDYNEKWKRFKSVLYGEATTIVIEVNDNCFEIYPDVHPLLLDLKEIIWNDDEPKFLMLKDSDEIELKNHEPGYNKIFYGIPGCGKSWHIENNVLANVNKKEDVFRTTFFLDYSNSDFVGQIYPVVDGDKVKYEYVPGPFTKALERALTVEDEHTVYLVIEEINRGNAAAIFGDLFQLLDRLDSPRDGRVIGDSEYPISNAFIEGYFEKHNIPFDKGNIYIPHNLTILATMNTSDQNVFPLDTAFQRRWDREKIVTNLDNSKYAELYVPGTEIKWKDFASKINVHMIEDCGDMSVTEDKNLGAYFATDAMLCYEDDTPEIKKKKAIRFANNVMEYLFGTAVKFAPEVLFSKEYDRYQKVYDEMENFLFDIDQSEEFIKMLADKVAKDLKSTITPSPVKEDNE